MGADLIFTTLAASVESPSDLNFDAARQWVADNPDVIRSRMAQYDPDLLNMWDLANDEGELVDDEELIPYVQGALTDVESSLGAGDGFSWRNTGFFQFGGVTFFVLGETSWGDSPEGMDSWTLVQNVAIEALNAAGFLEGLRGASFATGTYPVCDECKNPRYYTPCEYCQAREGSPWASN